MYDLTIIGAGIVGLSVAYETLKSKPNLKLLIIEKESVAGSHQTGHNSGVIHSGIYYKPNSLKAINCRNGIKLLTQFCNENEIKFQICGKIILATNETQLSQLKILKRNGLENGIKNIKYLKADEISHYEPYAEGHSALHIPETGIINYGEVCKTLLRIVSKQGEVKFGEKVIKIDNSNKNEISVDTISQNYKTKFLINCAGLYSDLIAEKAGFSRKSRIVPFRGEYFKLKKKSSHLVKNLIYPVPDLNYPFLGVHFTRMINGDIEAGPNAVLAWAREGYSKTNINIREMFDYISYKGFWKMSKRYWPLALKEYYRSFFKSIFVRDLQKLVPQINADDIITTEPGVRAQALGTNGKLIDDFIINNNSNMICIINAPSPAATSSLSIAQTVDNLFKKMYNAK